WRSVHETPGQGLGGIAADGTCWRLGAARWAGAEGDGTVLACDGAPVARFVFDERLRDDARAAVQSLHADGVRVMLLSGDAPDRAAAMAAALGPVEAHGGLAPEDKLEAVRAAQRRGETVAMLGDGINDAPVLAQSDVSIAMGEGALVARTQADGVLVSNRLGDVVQARRLARRTVAVVRQNLAWAAFY